MTTITGNPGAGDSVLVTEDNSSPMKWPLERVTKVIHGKGGVARLMDVSTTIVLIRRPAVKLRCLPLGLTEGVSQGGRHFPEFGLDSKKESTNEK